MKKRIISAALGAAIAMSAFTGIAGIPVGAAEAKTPQYQTTAREMEKLNRGLVAVKTTADGRDQAQDGVYLSWRLLGSEALESQEYDIYRNDDKIITTTGIKGTNYTDEYGTANDTYRVVKTGESKESCPAVKPINSNRTARGSLVGNASEKNSYTYIDIPLQRPADLKRDGDEKTSYYHNTVTSDGSVDKEGGANDASVGDLDGDGDYELIVKWDPTDSKDSAGSDYTGRTYLDAYNFDLPNNGETEAANVKLLWRIDLGQNVTSGQHFSPFMVYDFDGDGEAELAVKTAPGSYSTTCTDSTKRYVTGVGDTDEIKKADNNYNYVKEGAQKGKNTTGPEYLTLFESDGTPAATTDYIPRGNLSDWGDNKANRSERYVAGVAYLDGVHPSIIMCRGYYNKAALRAYDWDGETLSLRWEHNGNKDDKSTMYGQGNHNMSIADIDNDGRDEIVWGSACLDDDGKTVLGNTRLGHGDAMHVNDFNNDGKQEVFSVKEDKAGYKNNAADFRVAATGQNLWKKGATSDNGRGIMDNLDDEYAAANPETGLAIASSSAHANAFDLKGNELGVRPATSSRTMQNFLTYWDGDLGRELLDDNQLTKYHVNKQEDGTFNSSTTRFYDDGNGYLPISSNNYTKHTPSLVADIFGDWREEIIAPIGKGPNDTPCMRILFSTLPSDYRLTTLMHDSQYRCAVAWQNGGYNQPPHTSYYIGSAALATNENGDKLNYLAPASAYTKFMEPENAAKDPVTSLSLSEKTLLIEKGSSTVLAADILPETASKKVSWSSSQPNIASVSNGIVTALAPGTTTITAVSSGDQPFSDTCEVTVYSTPVEGLSMPGYDNMTIMSGIPDTIEADVLPSDATDKALHWSSTNENVATVDSGGLVSGVGMGSSIIRAVTNEGGYTQEKIVTVSGSETDELDDEIFTTSDATMENDVGVEFKNNTKTGVNIHQVSDPNGASAQKDFKVYNNNKAVLSFRMHTGAQKSAQQHWDWTGREYSLNVQLLDADGANILQLTQPYEAASTTNGEDGADVMTSKKTGNDPAVFSSDWDNISGSINYIQGSSKRWIVTVEFDYNSGMCTATIVGTDNTWTPKQCEYTTTFEIGDANFKTLKVYTTKDGDENSAITANPTISEISYKRFEPSKGVGSKLYDKATIESNKWTDADLSDWTATWDSYEQKPSVTENGFGYSPVKPASSYSSTKTFEIEDNALVTYDADWEFNNITGRLANKEFIQFGSNIVLAVGNDSTKGYFGYVSTDGGNTWNENENIFNTKGTFTKNIHLVVDTQSNTINSFKFDGEEIDTYTGYKLPGSVSMDSVSLGFKRGGAPDSQAECINRLHNLTVLQFVEGAEQPATPTPEVTETPDVTEEPTTAPGGGGVTQPTATPTEEPTHAPTPTPTASPTAVPTESPTADPAATPTTTPGGGDAPSTEAPTASPTATPTTTPGGGDAPSTEAPTASPTATPTTTPGGGDAPSTEAPTSSPAATPTTTPGGGDAPSTEAPTSSPTATPTTTPGGGDAPSTEAPTANPEASPEVSPNASPEATPSATTEPEPTSGPEIGDKYIVNNITISDGKVSVDVIREIAAPNAKLIAASYASDNRLIGVAFMDVDSTDTFGVNLNTEGAAYVSAFIWKDISNMVPISNRLNRDL